MADKSSSPEQTIHPLDVECIRSPEVTDLELKNILSKREKWFIVALISLTSFFSPFTATIYYPAIPTMARAFNKSTELINLTVTTYVIVQGTAPMFWGTLSDNLGRRPIAGACLLILMLSCIGLALTPTSAYWLLLVLRCAQAAGSASTLAIGAGVISDISTPAERGGFYGVFALGPMTGPALGPVIGGALTQGLGWRSVFWFLCIAVAICLVIFITLFPETLPNRQHSNTRTLKLLYNPLIPIIGREAKTSQTLLMSGHATPPPSPEKRSFQNPLRLFLKRNIVLALIINASSFSVFFVVITSLSTLFEQTYPFLNDFTIGLCFLSIGGSQALGAGIIGKFLDWRYQTEKLLLRKTLEEKLGREGVERKLKDEDVKGVDKLMEFPLERARLKYLAEANMVLAVSSAGYGWCISHRASIAAPLILQAISTHVKLPLFPLFVSMCQYPVGTICMATMNSTTTLLIDQAPGQGSSVSACSNLVRCTIAAIIVSIVQPIINGIGVGWTYVLFAIYVLGCIPCCYTLIIFGPKWRMKERKAAVVEPSSRLENDSPTSIEGKGSIGSGSSPPLPVCLSAPNVEIGQAKKEQ